MGCSDGIAEGANEGLGRALVLGDNEGLAVGFGLAVVGDVVGSALGEYGNAVGLPVGLRQDSDTRAEES